MAAYNAATTIVRAVESVRSQSFGDWELVIADDCSTDATPRMAARLAETDKRIKLVREPRNSGACYRPRKTAVLASSGDYILGLDADDELAPGHLAAIADRIADTGADTVLTRQRAIDDSGKTIEAQSVRSDSFMAITIPGKELVKETLMGWRIAFRGAVKREIYDAVFTEGDEPDRVFADEVLSRRLLMKSRLTAFAPTDYIYHLNPVSITHVVKPSFFYFLTANRRLMEITSHGFGPDSEEHTLACRQFFYSVYDALGILFSIPAGPDRDSAEALVKEAYRCHDYKTARKRASGKLRLLSYAGWNLMKTVYRKHVEAERREQL